MDEKENYKIKKAVRDDEKQKQSNSMRKKRVGKKITKYILLLLVFVIAIYGLFLLAKSNEPKGVDHSKKYSIQTRTHIKQGEENFKYNSNPPSSGPHYGTTVRGGYYDEILPDQAVIHNLEHGDIWITYSPQVSDEVKSTLKKFGGQYLVVSQRPENEDDISLVAWGRVDTFSVGKDGRVDEERIKDFIKRYDNRGPEKLRGTQTGHSGF